MQKLHCPKGHQWDPPVQPSRYAPATRGECPVCGEAAAVDCLSDSSGLLTCLILAMIGLVFASGFIVSILMLQVRFGLTKKQSDSLLSASVWGIGLVVVLIGWVRRQRDARQRLASAAEVAEVLGLRFTSLPGPEQREEFAGFPLFKEPAPADSFEDQLTGTYRGQQVTLFDFTFRVPGGKGMRSRRTVAVFLDPLPLLPDFRLEPTIDRSQFYNKNLFTLLGLRRAARDSDRLFNQRYQLATDALVTPEELLGEETCDVLARVPGWEVQARGGRLLYYRPGYLCEPALYGTFLAVTWRLRQMIVAAREKEAGATDA